MAPLQERTEIISIFACTLDDFFEQLTRDQIYSQLTQRPEIYSLLDKFILGEQNVLFFCAAPATNEDIELLVSVEAAVCTVHDFVVYFVRPPGERRLYKKDVEKFVTFGKIDQNVLASFEELTSGVYITLSNAQEDVGGPQRVSTEDQISRVLRSLQTRLRDSKRKIACGIEFRRPDPAILGAIDSKGSKSVQDSDGIKHLEDVVESWISQLEGLAAETKTTAEAKMLQEKANSGASSERSIPTVYQAENLTPETEVFFWKDRTVLCQGVADQLKQRDMRAVLSILTNVRSRVVKSWKAADNLLTDTLNEARDNAKLMSSIEPLLDAFMKCSLNSDAAEATVEATLPPLINNVFGLAYSSTFYQISENLERFLLEITNFFVEKCLRYLSRLSLDGLDESVSAPSFNGDADIWTMACDDVARRIDRCTFVLKFYQEQFRLARDRSIRMHSGRMTIEEDRTFRRLMLLFRRAGFLQDMFSAIRQYRALEAKEEKISGAKPLCERFNKVFDRFVGRVDRLSHPPSQQEKGRKKSLVISADVDAPGDYALDIMNDKFDKGYIEFWNVKITEIDEMMEDLVKSSFEAVHATSSAIKLLRSFEEIIFRDKVQAALEERYSMIFAAYSRELEEVQLTYDKHKKHPPPSRNIPPVANAILWARQLLNRIETPMNMLRRSLGVEGVEGVEAGDEGRRSVEDSSRSLGANIQATRNEGRRIIKSFNMIAKALVRYETIWQKAWEDSVDDAKSALQATLLVRHPVSDRIVVNFDPEAMKLIKEAKALSRLGINIPEAAKMVVLQEEKFISASERLEFALEEFSRVSAKVYPLLKPLLQPFVEAVDNCLHPGLSFLTWQSMNIDNFLLYLHKMIKTLDDIISTVNSILETRVDRPIRSIARLSLSELPDSESVMTLRQFVSLQESTVQARVKKIQSLSSEAFAGLQEITEFVVARQLQIRGPSPSGSMRADSFSDTSLRMKDVERLAETIFTTPMKPPKNENKKDENDGRQERSIRRMAERELRRLVKHYNRKLYFAVQACIKNSLLSLKKRLGSRMSGLFLFIDAPLFDVDVEISVPDIVMSPSIHDIQNAINRCAHAMLTSAKEVKEWEFPGGASAIFDEEEGVESDGEGGSARDSSLFTRLASDKDVLKVVILLTGSIEGLKKEVMSYLDTYRTYDFLWKEDKVKRYEYFLEGKPTQEKFEEKLGEFNGIAADIWMLSKTATRKIPPVHNIGPISLETQALKTSLIAEVEAWKNQFGLQIKEEAEVKAVSLHKKLVSYRVDLEGEPTTVDDLRHLMGTLTSIIDEEWDIEENVSDIEAKYAMLTDQGVRISRDTMQSVETLRDEWRSLQRDVVQKKDKLHTHQSQFKRRLNSETQALLKEAAALREQFSGPGGPMGSALPPAEAQKRLSSVKETYESLLRRAESVEGGERLFNVLPLTCFTDLEVISSDIALLDAYLSLHREATNTCNAFEQTKWAEAAAPGSTVISKMEERLDHFRKYSSSLPSAAERFDALAQLRERLNTLWMVLPLLSKLRERAIRPRHWVIVLKLTEGQTISKLDLSPELERKLQYCRKSGDMEDFLIGDLLKLRLHDFDHEIEELCIRAIREAKIESQLRLIVAEWSDTPFRFHNYNSRGNILLLPEEMSSLMARLEDSQVSLETMRSETEGSSALSPSMNSSVGLSDEISLWLARMSSVGEVIEDWLSLQEEWCRLEPIFSQLLDQPRHLHETRQNQQQQQQQQQASLLLPTTIDREDIKRFHQAEKKFLGLIHSASQARSMVQFCTEKTSSSTIDHCRSQFNVCHAALFSWLQGERKMYPRTYFLSDDQLLQLLSQGALPKAPSLIDNSTIESWESAVRNHISALSGLFYSLLGNVKQILLHADVEKIAIGEGRQLPHLVISGVVTTEGESIVFRSPLIYRDSSAVLLKDLLCNVRTATEEEIMRQAVEVCSEFLTLQVSTNVFTHIKMAVETFSQPDATGTAAVIRRGTLSSPIASPQVMTPSAQNKRSSGSRPSQEIPEGMTHSLPLQGRRVSRAPSQFGLPFLSLGEGESLESALADPKIGKRMDWSLAAATASVANDECQNRLVDLLKRFISQVLPLGLRSMFTSDVEEAIHVVGRSNAIRIAWNGLSKKLTSLLMHLILIRKSGGKGRRPTNKKGAADNAVNMLNSVDTYKLESAIFFVLHARDVLEKFVASKPRSASEFDWQKQLRTYCLPEDEIVYLQCFTTKFRYGGELVGMTPHYVATSLSDRVVLTASQRQSDILHLCGPTQSGKVALLEHFASAVGRMVVHFNGESERAGSACVSLQNVLLGGLGEGLWVCLESVEGLSTTQSLFLSSFMEAVSNGRKERHGQIQLQGSILKCNESFRVCATSTVASFVDLEHRMPSYLRKYLHSYAVGSIDQTVLIVSCLAAAGFLEAASLGRRLSDGLSALSSRVFGDDITSFGQNGSFSLRNIHYFVKFASSLRRFLPSSPSEETILETALVEWLKARTATRVVLLLAVEALLPHFPGLKEELPSLSTQSVPTTLLSSVPRSMQLLRLVDKERAQMGLLKTPQQDAAIVSLFEVLERQRLGDGGANMVALLGGAGVGKSTVLRLLSTAMSGMTVASESDASGSSQRQIMHVINPKGRSFEQLFGSENGPKSILSNIVSRANKSQWTVSWMVFDGPVDPVWTHALLPLAAEASIVASTPTMPGETAAANNVVSHFVALRRFSVLPASRKEWERAAPGAGQVRVLLESADVRQMDPRLLAGVQVLFLRRQEEPTKEAEEIDRGVWWPIVWQCFCHKPKAELQLVESLCTRFLGTALTLITEYPLIKQGITQTGAVQSLSGLLFELLKPFSTNNQMCSAQHLEKLFIFAVLWSLGCCLNKSGQEKLEHIIREYSVLVPPASFSLYDVFVDDDTADWKPWPSTNLPIESMEPLRAQKDLAPSTIRMGGLRLVLRSPAVAIGSGRGSGDGSRAVILTNSLVRRLFVCEAYRAAGRPVLLAGGPSSGKSSLVELAMQKQKLDAEGGEGDRDGMTGVFTSRFSITGSSNADCFAEFIRKQAPRKDGRRIGPPRRKRCLVVVEDLHRAGVDEAGSRPLLEGLRFLLEHKALYATSSGLLEQVSETYFYATYRRQVLGPRMYGEAVEFGQDYKHGDGVRLPRSLPEPDRSDDVRKLSTDNLKSLMRSFAGSEGELEAPTGLDSSHQLAPPSAHRPPASRRESAFAINDGTGRGSSRLGRASTRGGASFPSQTPKVPQMASTAGNGGGPLTDVDALLDNAGDAIGAGLCPRLLRHFAVIDVEQPDADKTINLFSSVLNVGIFAAAANACSPATLASLAELSPRLVESCVRALSAVAADYRLSAARSEILRSRATDRSSVWHATSYVPKCNLRDIARVVRGFLRCRTDYFADDSLTSEAMLDKCLHLWDNEMLKVIADKCATEREEDLVRDLITDALFQVFGGEHPELEECLAQGRHGGFFLDRFMVASRMDRQATSRTLGLLKQIVGSKKSKSTQERTGHLGYGRETTVQSVIAGLKLVAKKKQETMEGLVINEAFAKRVANVSRLLLLRESVVLAGPAGVGKRTAALAAGYLCGFTICRLGTLGKGLDLDKATERIKSMVHRLLRKEISRVLFVLELSSIEDASPLHEPCCRFVEELGALVSGGEVHSLFQEAELESLYAPINFGELLKGSDGKGKPEMAEKMIPLEKKREVLQRTLADNTNIVFLCSGSHGRRGVLEAVRSLDWYTWHCSSLSSAQLHWIKPWNTSIEEDIAASVLSVDLDIPRESVQEGKGSEFLGLSSDDAVRLSPTAIARVAKAGIRARNFFMEIASTTTASPQIANFVSHEVADYSHETIGAIGAPVLPSTFFCYLNDFRQIFEQRASQVLGTLAKLTKSLEKLKVAGRSVLEMETRVSSLKEELASLSKNSDILMAEIADSTGYLEQKREQVKAKRSVLGAQAESIALEKSQIEEDLNAARPALDDAEMVLRNVSQKDISMLKNMKNPPDIIKRIFDAVLILHRLPIEPIQVVEVRGKLAWVDSYKHALPLIGSSGFLQGLMEFPKETLNDEMIELLAPYLQADDFSYSSAKRASGNVAGVLSWVRAMSVFHNVAKKVRRASRRKT